MLTTTTAWQTANAKWAKQPIYAMIISAAPGVTNPALPLAYVTHDLVRAGITGTLPTYEPWLKTPSGASQSIDVINGTSSIGEMTCEVVEQGGAVRGAVTAVLPIEGSTVTLAVGYPGLAWTDFTVLHTYVLYKIVPSPGYTSWLFTSRDPQWQLKQTIYNHPENGELLTTDNPWYLCGTPAEIVQAIALFALGLPASFIDRATLAQLDSPSEGLFAMARPFQFTLTESFTAKQFIETEVLKASLMYPVVTNAGGYSLRAGRPFAAGPVSVFTFTDDNMTMLPNYDRMEIYNQAAWSVDYDGSNYQQYVTYVDGTSISIFPDGAQFSMESKGLHSELGAFWYTQWISQLLFRRFSGTPAGLRGGAVVLDVEAFLMTLPVWVGDYVTVQSSRMPDVVSGALGVDRVYEVIDREPDYTNGKMRYKLLDTGLTGIPAAGTWGAGSANPFVIASSVVY
jgi:hypothetical protein